MVSNWWVYWAMRVYDFGMDLNNKETRVNECVIDWFMKWIEFRIE